MSPISTSKCDCVCVRVRVRVRVWVYVYECTSSIIIITITHRYSRVCIVAAVGLTATARVMVRSTSTGGVWRRRCCTVRSLRRAALQPSPNLTSSCSPRRMLLLISLTGDPTIAWIRYRWRSTVRNLFLMCSFIPLTFLMLLWCRRLPCCRGREMDYYLLDARRSNRRISLGSFWSQWHKAYVECFVLWLEMWFSEIAMYYIWIIW